MSIGSIDLKPVAACLDACVVTRRLRVCAVVPCVRETQRARCRRYASNNFVHNLYELYVVLVLNVMESTVILHETTHVLHNNKNKSKSYSILILRKLLIRLNKLILIKLFIRFIQIFTTNW